MKKLRELRWVKSAKMKDCTLMKELTNPKNLKEVRKIFSEFKVDDYKEIIYFRFQKEISKKSEEIYLNKFRKAGFAV